jgi:choline dehydrogenase-like flavoprotein
MSSLYLSLTSFAAGPGGSVVANRLTENTNATVLVIEAGGM